jgi:hypothetical protein
MITFPCKCGHAFNLTEDQAGGLTQCPRCGLLNDVPSLNDLAGMSADGTFNIDDAPPVTDGITLADLHEAFTPHTTDASGREKDLRQGDAYFRSVGMRGPLEPDRIAPRYDPVTGELVRPLELRQEQPRPVLPMEDSAPGSSHEPAPQAVLPVAPIKSISYAAGATRKHVTPVTLLLELFMPANAFVMFFVFLFAIVAALASVMLAVYSGLFHLPLQVLNIPIWMILAHYGCVIEDTGPDNRDELPRPLRNLSLGEDLWNPFIHVIIAGVICYFPAILAGLPGIPLGPSRGIIILLLQVIGSLFLPAVLLTSVTSGTIANLRPDRVLAVISLCGSQYLLSVIAYLLAMAAALLVFLAPALLPVNPNNPIIKRMGEAYVLLPLLAVSIYLAHFFCWHLGMMYRAHHEQFPWVLQRHVKRSAER